MVCLSSAREDSHHHSLAVLARSPADHPFEAYAIGQDNHGDDDVVLKLHDRSGYVSVGVRPQPLGCSHSKEPEEERPAAWLLSGEIGSEDPFHSDWPHW
jgi:hypothetical protein